ncbi:sensor histidine kinase [Cohnella hongkongensis]|uniref:histidine kinase n=1 Tax=Cohnella hongkongensis TaxID=178337 RepID=A0ABV9FFW8_9BACL
MTVTRKIFLSIASFVAIIVVLFVLVTHLVIKESFEAMASKSLGGTLETIAERFIEFYDRGKSWSGVQQMVLDDAGLGGKRDVGIALFDRDGAQVYSLGTVPPKAIQNLGIKRSLRVDNRRIASLYYYDAEIADLSRLRIGIPASVILLLSAATVLIVLLSLPAAYWIARKITSPLRMLIPAIERLRHGELGVQAPVVSRDEYGQVAVAFNAMSAQLRKNEEVRRNLVADAAHELRTPLTIVRGKLDLIQQTGEAIEPESLLPLQDELIRLSRLVEDLHLLSLAEARRLPLEKKPTSMADLVRKVVRHLEPDAERKRIRVSLKIEAEVRPIDVDPNRMTQVLLNLMVNAIRYTPESGSVTVSVQERPSDGRSGAALRIAIEDTGVGIAPEQLEQIFNRFYRTDEARARNSGGMGLGLAIAKELVLAHEGTLEAESRPGRGTTFVLVLPVSAGLYAG